MPESSSLYRPCVGVALFNHEGKVFVGERIDTPGAWQMPQGGMDDGEELLVAASRELFEETGILHADLLDIMPEKIRYDIPAETLVRLHKVWDKPYIGQEQTWIAMRFTGKDEDINLHAHEPAEFSQWKWESLSNVPALIVPFKRDVYAQVLASFARYSK